MNVDIIKHSEWAETKFTLHLISQILGKIKLETASQEPQWAHVALTVTPDGFSTGLLFFRDSAFQIDMDIRNSRICINVDGEIQSFPIEHGKSIKAYFEEIFQSLHSREIALTIHPKPQEMAYKNNLNEDPAPLIYDHAKAMKGLQLFQFAFREQMKLAGPLRCRKTKPGLFWGTFDLAFMILHGVMEPFPEDKVIEKAAFDEQMIEYGFWLGDENVDDPTFFVLPYPFLFKDLNAPSLKPSQAYYDKTLSEYFLDLQSVADAQNPSLVMKEFFHSTFDILSEELDWEGCEYYFEPLKMKKQ